MYDYHMEHVHKEQSSKAQTQEQFGILLEQTADDFRALTKKPRATHFQALF